MNGGQVEHESWAPPEVDIERANVARVYDALLGGSHNFAADRDVASAFVALNPGIRDIARANRTFLGRVVRYMAGQGIRQFLDIGSGVPTEGNVHEIAQRIAPESHVVYVDTDPVAIAHSRSILSGNDRATIVEADLREPEVILAHPEVDRLIDFSRPVGLLMVAVLPFITDEEGPTDLVRRLTGALAPGSYYAVSHGTVDSPGGELEGAVAKLYSRASAPVRLRERPVIEGFFDGFDLVEPGLVFIPAWRPDGPDAFSDRPEESWVYGAVGRKR